MRHLKDKNPLHASALRLRDINPGRRIIKFNRELGIIGEFEIVSRPFFGYLATREEIKRNPHFCNTLVRRFIVELHDTTYGTRRPHSLRDLGVIPYDKPKEWNISNFVIDARKRHLLPERVQRPSPQVRIMDQAPSNFIDGSERIVHIGH